MATCCVCGLKRIADSLVDRELGEGRWARHADLAKTAPKLHGRIAALAKGGKIDDAAGELVCTMCLARAGRWTDEAKTNAERRFKQLSDAAARAYGPAPSSSAIAAKPPPPAVVTDADCGKPHAS